MGYLETFGRKRNVSRKEREGKGKEKEGIRARSVSVADASSDPWEHRFVFRVSAGRVDLAVHARVRACVRADARVCERACVNEIQGGSSVSPVGRAGSLACPCPVLACRQRERASTMEPGKQRARRIARLAATTRWNFATGKPRASFPSRTPSRTADSANRWATNSRPARDGPRAEVNLPILGQRSSPVPRDLLPSVFVLLRVRGISKRRIRSVAAGTSAMPDIAEETGAEPSGEVARTSGWMYGWMDG